MLRIAALVGIVPAWFFDCFLLSGINLPLEYFRDNYDILTTTGHLRMLLESIAAAIESKFVIHVSCQKAENIICKVFQVLNPNTEESIYWDHHIKGLPFVWMKPGDKIVVSYVNGEEMMLSSLLISEWAFDGKWMSLYEIVVTEKMKKNLKDPDEFSFLEEFGMADNPSYKHQVEKIIRF